MNNLVALFIVISLAGLMIGLMALNNSIEKPAGTITPKCGSCNIVSCSHNPKLKGDKK